MYVKIVQTNVNVDNEYVKRKRISEVLWPHHCTIKALEQNLCIGNS